MVKLLFLAVPRGSLQFVIVVFPDHTHLLFFIFNHTLCFSSQGSGETMHFYKFSLAFVAHTCDKYQSRADPLLRAPSSSAEDKE